MKLLAVTPRLPRGAVAARNAPLRRQLDSLERRGVTVSTLELRGLPKAKYLHAFGSLRRMASRVDVVHAHYGFSMWLACLQVHRPVVVSFMGSDLLGTCGESGSVALPSRLAVSINRHLAARVAAVIVKSEEMARTLYPLPVHVIANGVDTDLFRPIDIHTARMNLNWSPDRHYILFPGDPSEHRKNYSLARSAAAVAARLVSERIEIISLANVRPSDVPLFMNGCDVVVLASHHEGSPNVIKEAMACNTPIVSVDVGDVRHLLADVDGSSVIDANAESLGNALARAIQRRGRTNGRNRILRLGLDLEGVASRLIRVYERVLNTRA